MPNSELYNEYGDVDNPKCVWTLAKNKYVEMWPHFLHSKKLIARRQNVSVRPHFVSCGFPVDDDADLCANCLFMSHKKASLAASVFLLFFFEDGVFSCN